MTPALLRQTEAAAYLGVEKRWLDDAPIEWVDLRKPGSSKPVKRWKKSTLDAVIEERTIRPGDVSRW